ncbi:MAG: FecR domain-containing protein [Chloroflexi bacterium]|nr:FecR domain-containing protein [Chloroflexota bacterium]
MKKVLAVFLVLVVAVVAFLYFPRGGVIEAVNAAVLAVLNSGVDASRGGGDFQSALDGDVFATGDVVRADDNGRAVLTFFDGSTVSVDPKSRVRVASLTKTGSGSLQLELEQSAGRTWASVSKLATPDSKFIIKTPSMVATVRGTTFETIVEAQPDGTVTTTIKTSEGEVVVQAAAGGTVTVPAGQQVDIQQNQPAPPAPQPIPPTPKLRLSGPAGVGFTVIDPRGLQCGLSGTALQRQIPKCDVLTGAGQTVVIGEVVAGTYSLVATAAAAVANAAIVAEGLGASGAADFSVKLERSINVGDLLRSTLPVTITSGTLGSAGFTAPELVTSVCGAEATGRVFSGGGLTERADALVAFAAQQKGAPVALVYTQAELSQFAAASLTEQQAQLPVKVSNVKLAIDNAGLHLAADVAAGPLNITAKGDVIAGTTTDGKLLMRMRNIEAGPLPSAARDQIIAAIDRGLATFAQSMPLSVTRVAFRSGCFALIGKTPS